MAQTNFTPILLYASSTATNVPLAANLTNSATGSEIAINIADKNLFFKDSGGVVNTVPIRQSGTSSNGWLSATDWNTFNGKAPATSGTSILYGNGSGGFSNVTIGSGISFAGGTLSATGSGGTVTSVTGTSPVVSSGGTTPAISLATAYGDTLNPYASKTANYILAAPNGSAGVPTFRALVAADLPSLSSVYIPYTGASSAIDLNAQTVTNIAHLGINTTSVPDILLRAFGDNNSASRIAIRGYSSNASSSSMRVAKFRGTYAAPQAPLSGDSLGKFELAGYGTTSANGYPQASYEGVATENWGATARGAKALFYVTPNTTIIQAVALTLDQDKSATFASSVTATSFSGSGSSLTGVVTSVGATSPVTSTGGQTPTIAMPAATTSVNGYLTSTDWNTFNNKGSGTVTSVTGTAPVVSSGGATPAISMAAATASVNGYLTSTDWTTFNNKTSNTGTVTSVAATVPAFLSISGSPITTSGTLAISYSGTALPVANGGTGLTTLTAGYIPYGNGTSAFSSSSSLYFSSTQLGVGTSSPGTTLDINGIMRAKTWSLSGISVTGGTTDYSAGTVTTNVNWGFYFVAPTGSGAIADYAFFNPAGTERARIPNAGGFQCVDSISVGNATPTTSGAGVSFPATQSASTDANTLDDYEEGTWTPIFVAQTGTLGSITYQNVQGTYTKIGNLVYITGGFYNSTFAAGTGSGDLRISGLPFAPSSTGANIYSLAISDSRLWTLNNPTSAYASGTGNAITLFYRLTANGVINNLQVSDASNGAATNLVYFSGCYRV